MVTSARRWLAPLALWAVLFAARPPEAKAQDVPAAPGVARVDANESFLHWMARASGPIGLVIAGDVVLPDRPGRLDGVPVPHGRSPSRRSLVREVGDLLGQKQYTEAYQRLAADPSFLARVLAAGVRKLPSGLPAAQRAMELANDDATMEMEHRTTYLATVGTLGPMIGLVGTVYGMILSFRVIATAGASPQASQLAGGDLDGPVRHARRDRPLDPGDLLLRPLPQPDRPALAGGGDGGRAAPGAVRAGRPAAAPAGRRRRRRPSRPSAAVARSGRAVGPLPTDRLRAWVGTVRDDGPYRTTRPCRRRGRPDRST